MRTFGSLILPLAVALTLTASAGTAQTLSGTLSNFDVFNDTSQVARGFEIELQGLTSRDISYTFGGTYIRYGDPAVTDIPGGVLVRYASAYDAVRKAFSVGTPIPPAFTATAGHQCWTGGSAGYAASGCEHFGVGLTRNPTSVAYRWLVEDAAAPGALKSTGVDSAIAAPLWVVTPGAAGGVPVVEAAIDPPKAPSRRFGEAVWVKVYETESAQSVELNHLLTDDPAVPRDSNQVETEWELSQSNPRKADNGVLRHGKPLGAGSKSVVRRFEFYKYTGAYDPESHEALCGARSGGHGSDCSVPQPGEIGNYVGAQMAAAQFGAIAPPAVSISAVSNSASGLPEAAAGSWISIYGSGLSPTSRPWQASDFRGAALPIALEGVSVSIDGKPAAISFVSPGQLNVQVPATAALGSVAVQVTNALGTAVGSVTLRQFAPAFFTFPGKRVAAVHADGTLVGPPGLFGAGVQSSPARPGEIILLFGTGFGPTTPPVTAGQVVAAPAPLAQPGTLQLRIGGQLATVQFAGIVAAGEFQFNLVVPAAPNGEQPVSAEIGGVSAVAGLTVTIAGN